MTQTPMCVWLRAWGLRCTSAALLPGNVHWLFMRRPRSPPPPPRPGGIQAKIQLFVRISRVAFRQLETVVMMCLVSLVWCGSWLRKTVLRWHVHVWIMWEQISLHSLWDDCVFSFLLSVSYNCTVCTVSLQASLDVPADPEECATNCVHSGQRKCSSGWGTALT